MLSIKNFSAFIFLLSSLNVPARADTLCTLSLKQIFAGDLGMIWLVFTNDGSTYLAANSPDKEATLALAMTALTGGRTVYVRYGGNGVPCNAQGRSDITGLYLN